MNSFWLTELEEEIEFAKRAAKHFAENPTHTTFGDLKPETFLAIRWGLGEDCVLVTKIEDKEPRNYMGLVKQYVKI